MTSHDDGATADAAWQPPQEFDEYRLVRRLGGGAMGEVYLAQDVLLDRRVAVKFVAVADAVRAAASERFYVEARAIARLQHPHVVAVYRVGRVRQRPYLVSEYVPGESLDRIALPLPSARVIEIGVALASGLAAAHRRGVLHRDIKPANAMMSDAGDIKLVDFGLAKLLDQDPGPAASDGGAQPDAETTERRDVAATRPERASPPGVAETRPERASPPGVAETRPARASPADADTAPAGRTRPGTLLGSPLYMAPEMWRGEPATAASDQYSLGILLYELCAGRPPRGALSLDELRRDVLACDVPPLATVAPAVPAGLAAVIERCASREPADRFASADALRSALGLLRDGDVVAPIAVGDPYRGLHPFGAEHRAVFYGRDADAAAVIGRLRVDPFVLVVGDSGAGKSSLCAAGVLPRLADRGLGAIHGNRARAEPAATPARSWSWVELVPGRQPLISLARALSPVIAIDETELAELLFEDPVDVNRELRRCLGPDRGLIIYVDQLEELVTVADPEQAALVGEVLGDLAMRAPSVRLLATARSDFLVRLTELPRLGAEIARALYLLAPLTGEGIRDAIVGPARAAGVEFESDALVGELAAAAHGGDGLPLLQFALATLWQARDRERRVIPAAALAAIGGVGGALAGHADRVIDQLFPAERAAAQRVLLRLVTTEGTRVRRAAAELDPSPEGAAALEALVRGRLVVAREGETYELAHEVLISAWGTLRAWMSGDVERRAARERIERAAREWDRLGRAADSLWGPRQLAELDAVDPADLGPREAAFVAASRRARRRRRMIRRGLAAGVLLVLALAYAGFQLQTDRARAKHVAAQVDIADRALASAREHEAELDQLRPALAGFDANPVEPEAEQAAEAAWARHREVVTEIDRSHGEAERALETALLLDATSGDVRRRFGELLYTRAATADRAYQHASRDAYLDRLAVHDLDGALRRRWDEPGRLAIASRPSPASVDIARYADDPHRALGPIRRLGATPWSDVLPPGSYLMMLTVEGRPPVRYPIVIGRGEARQIEVELPAVVPAGYVYVPAGRFLYGSAGDDDLRVGFFQTQPIHPVEIGSFFIAGHEVTFDDWIEYLDTLPADEQDRRMPNAAAEEGWVRLEQVAGRWQLTLQPEGRDGPKLQASSGEKLRYPGRTRRVEQNWRRFPVSGVSWDDLLAYARWLDRTGRVPGARPCNEREWERAARGADDRRYPHGDVLAPDDANVDITYDRKAGAYGPDEVGAHRASNSPFGVADMAGNVWEWTRGVHDSQLPRIWDWWARGVHEEVVFRSSTFYRDSISNMVVGRNFGTATTHNNQLGARLCADVPEDP